LLRVRLLGPGDRQAAGAAWESLDAQDGVGSLTTSWTWTCTWLEHYGADVRHHFALAEEGGEPVGAALLTFSGDRLRGRSLHLGTAGEPASSSVFVEHNTLHALPGRERDFATALMGAAADLGGWDRLALDGFRPGPAGAITAAGRSGWRSHADRCPVTDLAAVRTAGGDVTDLLPPSRRARVRRTVRALGEVDTDWCGEPAAALSALDELADLNRRR
jgi:hypothetical protein